MCRVRYILQRKYPFTSKAVSFRVHHSLQGYISVLVMWFLRQNTTKEEEKDNKHYTLFLLFGPPFSFWYKSSLFWKKKKQFSDIKSCIRFFMASLFVLKLQSTNCLNASEGVISSGQTNQDTSFVWSCKWQKSCLHFVFHASCCRQHEKPKLWLLDCLFPTSREEKMKESETRLNSYHTASPQHPTIRLLILTSYFF